MKSLIAITLAVAVGACQDGATDDAKDDVVETSASSDTFTGALDSNADLSTSAKLIDTAQLGAAWTVKAATRCFCQLMMRGPL